MLEWQFQQVHLYQQHILLKIRKGILKLTLIKFIPHCVYPFMTCQAANQC